MTTKEIAAQANLTVGAQELVRDDLTPSQFLETLERATLFEDAVNFLAHKLSPESGVKWALECIRDLQAPEKKDAKNPSLDACDAWVKAPGDPTRWAARESADQARDTGPADVLALGVFFSGGSITPPGSPETHPPPGCGQRFIGASVHLTVVLHQPEHADERHKRVLMLGRLYDTGA
jgi:hypothetical protein